MLDLHHLPGSELEEKNIFTFRRHPITLLPLALTTLVLFAIPPGAFLFFQNFFPDLYESLVFQPVFFLVASIFFLAGWLFVFQSFIDYWLDVFILTDKRILDIEQHGLWSRTVSELRLYRTQDVTSEVKGFWHTMFDYGDIFVQTAGEQERFHCALVPHPNHVAKLILEWSEQDRKEHLKETVEDFGMPDHE
ncbi:MAG: PH domain-containing protein [Patescibacteria group bacterium]